MGELKKIFLKRGRLAPMDEVEQAILKTAKGIVGNLEQNIARQITIIEEEVWAKLIKKYHKDLPPEVRRANLLVSGLKLKNSRKKILVVGDCKIEIFGETKPCERMDQAAMGLQEDMSKNWRGGVFGKALNDGIIKKGDRVHWNDI